MLLVDAEINRLTLATQQASVENNLAARVIPLIDLTSLNDNDTEQSVLQLCAKSKTSLGNVAAVCIYPQFVKTAKNALQSSNIKIATVANFPYGNDDHTSALNSIKQSIADGADEIDVVMPYQTFLAGDKNTVHEFIHACKQVCGTHIILKVILETGAIQKTSLIKEATEIAIEAGANFIKTSTGKIPVGATLEAAATILLTIKQTGRSVGFKASGGVRTAEQAAQYLHLAELILGKDWISPQSFRIGASGLLDILLT